MHTTLMKVTYSAPQYHLALRYQFSLESACFPARDDIILCVYNSCSLDGTLSRAPAQAPRRLHFERVATCQSRDHAHARLIDIPKLVPATFPDHIQMFTC